MKTPEDEAFEEIERIQRTRTRWVPVPKPVQVSIDEFMVRMKVNPDEKGEPIIWTQWPTKEKNNA